MTCLACECLKKNGRNNEKQRRTFIAGVWVWVTIVNPQNGLFDTKESLFFGHIGTTWPYPYPVLFNLRAFWVDIFQRDSPSEKFASGWHLHSWSTTQCWRQRLTQPAWHEHVLQWNHVRCCCGCGWWLVIGYWLVGSHPQYHIETQHRATLSSWWRKPKWIHTVYTKPGFLGSCL